MQPATAPRADDEGHGDDTVDVHAHQGSDVRILRRRTHGHADARAVYQVNQAQHHHRREGNDGHLHIGKGGPTHFVHVLFDHRRESDVIPSPDDHRQVLQDDRHADCSDQRGQPRRVPQRAVGHSFEGPAEDHADHHRNQRTDAENQ